MKRNIEHYAPVGYPFKTELKLFLIGFTISLLFSFGYLFRYVDARNNLYTFTYEMPNQKILVEGAKILPFDFLIGRSFWGFSLLSLIAVGVIFFHYYYHSQGSKSIYLMKRLPDSRELLRRCITLPILIIGVIILTAILLKCIYYGIYLYCTPPTCLPEDLPIIWSVIL